MQILEESVLKNLHRMLLKLSDACSHQESLQLEMQSLERLRGISDLLFKELEGLFGRLAYVAAREKRDYSRHSCNYPVLLLRCCLLILHPLELKDIVDASQRCEVLVELLEHLCCLDYTTQHPHRCSSVEPSACVCSSNIKDPATMKLRCSLLEVFLDELSIHQNIRKLFTHSDRFLANNQKLFTSHRFIGRAAIFELIHTHFALSINDKAFNKYLNSMFCSREMDHAIPQVSLTAIMPLLWITVMCPVPRMLQIHLILLASRTIEIYASQTSLVSVMVPLHNYIASFDQSVNLYSHLVIKLLSSFNKIKGSNQTGDCLISTYISEHFPHLSINSYHQLSTKETMNSHVNKEKLYDHCPVNLSCEENEVCNAINFVKENIDIIDEPFRQEVSQFLRDKLAADVSCKYAGKLDVKHYTNWQDVYCAAALLKLMSSLLFKVVCVFKGHGTSDGIRYSKDHFLHKEYMFLHGTIYSFIQSCGNFMGLKFTFVPSETNSAIYDRIYLVLEHFICLLAESLQCGYEHLWKGCILMIMSLLNLLVFEEDNINSLKRLFHDTKTSHPSRTLSNISQVKSCRKSSFAIALNFQKIQASNLLTLRYNPKVRVLREEKQSDSLTIDQDQDDMKVMAESDRCNSANYLSLTGCNPSDVDDLANFIDCRNGKDYSILLMNRKKFRKWKHKKMRFSRLRERLKRSSILKML